MQCGKNVTDMISPFNYLRESQAMRGRDWSWKSKVKREEDYKKTKIDSRWMGNWEIHWVADERKSNSNRMKTNMFDVENKFQSILILRRR